MSLDSDTIKHLAAKRGLFIDIAIIGIAITGNFTDPPCVPLQMWVPFPGWLLCPVSGTDLAFSLQGNQWSSSQHTMVLWTAVTLGHTGDSHAWLGKFRRFT